MRTSAPSPEPHPFLWTPPHSLSSRTDRPPYTVPRLQETDHTSPRLLGRLRVQIQNNAVLLLCP